jgi:hypothetical protein
LAPVRLRAVAACRVRTPFDVHAATEAVHELSRATCLACRTLARRIPRSPADVSVVVSGSAYGNSTMGCLPTTRLSMRSQAAASC